MADFFDILAARVSERIPVGPRVAVLGGTELRSQRNPKLCTMLGAALADLNDLVLLTGGVTGVGETVGRAFAAARNARAASARVLHILPEDSKAWDYGLTLGAGQNMHERREVLARLAPVLIVVEGGPGTAHEAAVGRARGGFIVPVGVTGGASGDEFALGPPRVSAAEPHWAALGDAGRSNQHVIAATVEIVRACLAAAADS